MHEIIAQMKELGWTYEPDNPTGYLFTRNGCLPGIEFYSKEDIKDFIKHQQEEFT